MQLLKHAFVAGTKIQTYLDLTGPLLLGVCVRFILCLLFEEVDDEVEETQF